MTVVTNTKSPYSTAYRVRKGLRIGLNYLVLIAMGFFFLFPTIFMIVLSLQPDETQLLADQRTVYAFIPRAISFQNYLDVFDRVPFARMFMNSTIIVFSIIIIGLLINSMIAYALARMQWSGRNVILALIVSLIIIPFESVSIPLLLMVNRFGWLDSYHVQIIPFVADAFSIFLFYQFFINLPKDLEEAALVDGASRFRMYWQIVVPLSRPVFATVAILQFIFRWGEFLWPLMVTRGFEFRPLTVGMQTFFGQAPRQWGDILAFAAMMTLPVLIFYLLFQKWFVQSVATSGVKG